MSDTVIKPDEEMPREADAVNERQGGQGEGGRKKLIKEGGTMERRRDVTEACSVASLVISPFPLSLSSSLHGEGQRGDRAAVLNPGQGFSAWGSIPLILLSFAYWQRAGFHPNRHRQAHLK